MASEFVHLHNHSDYSLLDGAQNIDVMLDTILALGMDAIALTEHGNMFSAIQFYNTAKKKGIKPIIGSEVYVAKGKHTDKSGQLGGGSNHLILLAQNYIGYKNLMKLITYGYLDGFYYRPRIDKELLRKHSDGLIALSACLKGEIPERIVKNDYKGAKKAALEFAEIFPGRFYLEVQNHRIPEEQINITGTKRLAEEIGLPIVATNDAHYAKKEHYDAHDILICLSTGKERNDPNRMRYATDEFYLKSQDEMYALFKDIPGAIKNTRRIADSIDLEIPLGEYHLPNFPIPDESTSSNPDDYLYKLCNKGLNERYGGIDEKIQSRFDHEIGVIKKMGFAGYFLITADFVKYAKENGIPVGPGRGSAAGSIVSYALGITSIDPLKYNLLFERFLNPERISLPDIDIDFCIERRGEVIDYIKRQYGENAVTQIITFGKMKARQVVRDVGRVMSYPYSEVDKIAKAIPEEINISLKDAIEKSPELREYAEGEFRELIQHSLVLEGMNRHASTHAAGVVIAPSDLTDYVPLYKSSQGDITSQYDMKGLEDLGLLKMDFLGLRTLTVIDKAVKLIKLRGVEVDIDGLQYDDQKVFKLFAKGMTAGIFQFESSGMREFLKKLKPTALEDLIAMNALYRPGPMNNINDYIDRKHRKKKIIYPHPDLEPILKETHGIIVYQEQVMQIANKIGGFSMAEADIMRRAMGKKIAELMKESTEKFIAGAINRGINESKANEIVKLIETFAQYGFNKSHATAYAIIAYQTAWLKTYYPAEFMSANLTSEMSNSDRVVILINECRKLGIKVNAPDINVSDVEFRPINDKTISFGINAVKNVGTKTVEKIIDVRAKNRKFTDIFDLCSRVDLHSLNKKVLESLIKAGAMDSLHGTRAQMFASIDNALKYGHQRQDDASSNQVGLFASSISLESEVVVKPPLSEAEEWSEQESLDQEKEVLGLYLSGHPLLKYADDLEEFSNFDFSENISLKSVDKIQIGGIIRDLRHHYDRKNNQMAFFNLDCLGGQAEILIFSDTYERYKNLIEDNKIVFIQGKPTDRSDFADLKLIADQIVPLENCRELLSRRVNIRLTPQLAEKMDLEKLHRLAEQFRGSCSLIFHIANGQLRQRILAQNIKVSSNKLFLQKLREEYGEKNIWVE
ncbi:DNA polymerase III subunit alpha [bacterium]|nr:DNA polymerase III subunit alpha [bacterium]